jgi:hypothetical protein
MTVHNSSVPSGAPPASKADGKLQAAPLEKLREEIAATEHKATQALLLHEAGELQEARAE